MYLTHQISVPTPSTLKASAVVGWGAPENFASIKWQLRCTMALCSRTLLQFQRTADLRSPYWRSVIRFSILLDLTDFDRLHSSTQVQSEEFYTNPHDTPPEFHEDFQIEVQNQINANLEPAVEADLDAPDDGRADVREMILQSFAEKLNLLVATKSITTTNLKKFNDGIRAQTANGIFSHFAFTKRNGKRIHTQPTAAQRRKCNYRGNYSLTQGRPPRAATKKAPHRIGKNITNNRAPARKH